MEKFLKRIFCVIFSLIISLSMASCGNASKVETSYFDKPDPASSAAVSDTTVSSVTERSEDSQTASVSKQSEDSLTIRESEISETSISSETSVPSEEMVWVSATGKKYHVKENCSNMKNPSHIPLFQAKASGYEPCKKCHG